MSSDWTAVIGISLAVMAVVQAASFIIAMVGLRQMQVSVQRIERRVDTAVDEFRPHVLAILEEARSTSANAQGLMRDVKDRMDSMDEAARSVRAGVNRVADGVQWAVTALPLPMKVSAPAAMAAWATVRAVGGLVQRIRLNRRLQKAPVGAGLPPFE